MEANRQFTFTATTATNPRKQVEKRVIVIYIMTMMQIQFLFTSIIDQLCFSFVYAQAKSANVHGKKRARVIETRHVLIRFILFFFFFVHLLLLLFQLCTLYVAYYCYLKSCYGLVRGFLLCRTYKLPRRIKKQQASQNRCDLFVLYVASKIHNMSVVGVSISSSSSSVGEAHIRLALHHSSSNAFHFYATV